MRFIVTSYIIYIKCFTNPLLNVPESMENSTEINYGEVQVIVEQFILLINLLLVMIERIDCILIEYAKFSMNKVIK